MPKLSKAFKEAIKNLSETEKERIIFKLATKHEAIFETLSVQYLKEKAEDDLMEQARERISLELENVEGKNPQAALSKAVTQANKHIIHLKKVTKNRRQEIELNIFLLETVFVQYGSLFGSNYRSLDNKIATMLSKTIDLIYEFAEPELAYDYKVSMDRFLEFIKRTSNFVDAVYELPSAL